MRSGCIDKEKLFCDCAICRKLFVNGNKFLVYNKENPLFSAHIPLFLNRRAWKTKKIRDQFAIENANPISRLASMGGTPNGIRTHVSALRGRRPRPLDNGGKWLGNKDLNLDNTSQSRRCCRYTIPQHAALGAELSTAGNSILLFFFLVNAFFKKHLIIF